MNLRQAIENLLPTSRCMQANTSTICGIGPTFKQALLRAPIHQFDNGVVLQSKGFGRIGNRRRTPCRNACDREQELVLLRMQACIDGCILADQQEFPQLMAEGCKSLM
jgi:hypothetical protein